MDLRGKVLEADMILAESLESRLRRERLNRLDKPVRDTFDRTDSGREEEGVGAANGSNQHGVLGLKVGWTHMKLN